MASSLNHSPSRHEIITGTSQFVDTRFALNDCFPNPASENTTVRFRINHAQHVSIRLYDVSGGEALVVTNMQYEPGVHDIDTDVSALSAGLYRLEMKTGVFRDSKSLVIKK